MKRMLSTVHAWGAQIRCNCNWMEGLTCKLIAILLGITFSGVALADYRDTPQGKLEAARKYADWFLAEDGKPGQQFFSREPSFPTWKDQPVIDCAIYAVVRAIEAKTPYFEDKKQAVVIVPVWVELLLLSVADGEGFPFGTDESGRVVCKFEYEQYSFERGRFEKVPDLLKKNYFETFKAWGTNITDMSVFRSRKIVIDPDKRYVRFNMRVSVAREAPYRLYPQFPRHHTVIPSLERWNSSMNDEIKMLSERRSFRGNNISPEQLEKDMENLRRNIKEKALAIELVGKNLTNLAPIESFSDIKE